LGKVNDISIFKHIFSWFQYFNFLRFQNGKKGDKITKIYRFFPLLAVTLALFSSVLKRKNLMVLKL